MTTTQTALPDDIQSLINGGWEPSLYRCGQDWICVLSGMPTDSVWIGIGDTAREAVASSTPTPIQSAPTMTTDSRALDWLCLAGEYQADRDKVEAADDDAWR